MSESEDNQGRTGFRKFAKKILSDEDGKTTVDPKEMLSSILQLSDKARTETVRLLAREFRGYLEALEIKDDVHDLLTSYSVEVNASFRLKPVKKSSSTTNGPTNDPINESINESIDGGEESEDSSEES